jgi:hypothetical protein
MPSSAASSRAEEYDEVDADDDRGYDDDEQPDDYDGCDRCLGCAKPFAWTV